MIFKILYIKNPFLLKIFQCNNRGKENATHSFNANCLIKKNQIPEFSRTYINMWYFEEGCVVL